jgi:hypothetical protein
VEQEAVALAGLRELQPGDVAHHGVGAAGGVAGERCFLCAGYGFQELLYARLLGGYVELPLQHEAERGQGNAPPPEAVEAQL